MSIPRQRQEEILLLMNKHGYITVSELTEMLHYSSATINRDLNALAKQSLIERTYGGARLSKASHIPFPERLLLHRNVKQQIGLVSAALIQDGDTVFIDGSTTTQYIANNLAGKKNLTIITNNTSLLPILSEMGFAVILLGGTILEKPYLTGGQLAAENAALFTADKMFFSTRCINDDGKIITDLAYREMVLNMMKNSKKCYYLVDSSKIGSDVMSSSHPTVLCTLDSIDAVISDYAFPEELKKMFQSTEFLCTDGK